MSETSGSHVCECTAPSADPSPPLTVHCECPRNERDIVVHEETCLLYKNERITYREDDACVCYDEAPPAGDVLCHCCGCPADRCLCGKAGREAFDEWRSQRNITAMPAVLEATHPLMQRFQATLKQFLEKENAIAEEEILNLKEELRLSKSAYDNDLERIYRDDHDTNAQRVLLGEYEETLAKQTADRQATEQRAHDTNERYRRAKEKLDEDINTEREASEEVEALHSLCRQLEAWREETESELTVSQRISDKMRVEKKAMADEKRQLDMMIYNLSNEVWKLESKLEMFKKQFEIKSNEMEKINDKVTAYSTELEDLDLDKRRLVTLWNSVLVNIQQRDKVYDSVREDYKMLQESYRTLLVNLEVTKKVSMEEMNRGKELAMNKDKLIYDINSANKLYDAEDNKRANLEAQIHELTEAIEMGERDEMMIKMENQTMRNILSTTEKDLVRKSEKRTKLENEILHNLQECLLNDKAVEAMAAGIRKMREMSRKQEVALGTMENTHAKVMLDIELCRSQQARNNQLLEANQEKVQAREKEIDALQEKYDQKALEIMRKQRELDIVSKKYTALKEIFDMKSPQERRIEELEMQIKGLRERTSELQHEWLRLQGHVVRLTAQYHKVVYDVNLLNKQIQICEQKTMRIQADIEKVEAERRRVERASRGLQGRLEVLERARRDAGERAEALRRDHAALSHEYAAKLKDADAEVFELEESIETMDKEKLNLTQELDRIQREALIWQRKGILAVELKKNMQTAKSAAGEIGQMRLEIHRMEVRREQLRRTSEKLSEDLALLVTRRENAMDKTRAQAAVEKAHGGAGHTSQSQYHHKLRLARADVQRVSKELTEAKAKMEHLKAEQARLEGEVAAAGALNAQLEESVAALLREARAAERHRQWLLERVVRSQRLGSELATAVKRQSVRVKKPKATVLAEYEQARRLEDAIAHVIRSLGAEYPQLDEQLAGIMNTLNVYEPGDAPQLTGDGDCDDEANVAEKPLSP